MPEPTTPTWRLVPVEPTQEMTEAGAGSIDDNGGNARWSDVREAWAAMLSAAPAPQELPPVQLPEPVATVESAGQGGAYTSAYVRWHGLAPVGTKLYTADQLRAAIAADRRAGGR